jgi:Mn2+/Fe2+ NRAMP family transporter
LTIFYSLLFSIYYTNIPLLPFDDFCAILPSCVGYGVGQIQRFLLDFMAISEAMVLGTTAKRACHET